MLQKMIQIDTPVSNTDKGSILGYNGKTGPSFTCTYNE